MYHTCIRKLVRAAHDLPVVIDSGRGDKKVILPGLVDGFIQVDHFFGANALAPEKSHLLHGCSASRREVTVTDNLVEIVDTQSYADIRVPPIFVERPEIDHAVAIM